MPYPKPFLPPEQCCEVITGQKLGECSRPHPDVSPESEEQHKHSHLIHIINLTDANHAAVFSSKLKLIVCY